MNSITISIGLPPKWLWPNQTVASLAGRRAKMAATKKYRRTSAKHALSELSELNASAPRWNHATTQAVFYWPSTRNYHDADNCLAALKSAFDGIADAGVIATDRNLAHYPVEQTVSQRMPRVEITITARMDLDAPLFVGGGA